MPRSNNNNDDSSSVFATPIIRYRDVMYSDDAESVATRVASNTLAANSRRMIFKRGPALILFGTAILLVSKDNSDQGSLLHRYFAKQEVTRRTSIAVDPYDTSSEMELPSWTDSFANVWDKIAKEDTPLFWSVPRSGGSTLMDVFSHCLDLTLASNKGIETSNSTLGVYEKVTPTVGDYPFTAKYVNVKTNNEYWIRKCKERGLLESGLVDVFTTSHLVYAANTLFGDEQKNKARGMVMMRHPVKRILDEFYSIQQDAYEHDAEHPNTVSSLKEFASSPEMIDNMQVRVLNGITDSSATTITQEHVNIAKEILRRKFMVGIYEWFDVSMVRFEKTFGWWEEMNVLGNMTINSCHYSIMEHGDEESYVVEKGTDAIYATIMKRSWADIELYHYAKGLFADQVKLL